MAEYIKREDAVKLIFEQFHMYFEVPCLPRDEAIQLQVCAVRDKINKIPAADVAPVVRCKDCKYYRVSAMLAPNKFCFRLKHPVEDRSIGYNFAPDDFCSHGKLKEPR